MTASRSKAVFSTIPSPSRAPPAEVLPRHIGAVLVLDVIAGADESEQRGSTASPDRLKGHTGAHTWAAWAILAYNRDTLAQRAT